MTKHWLISLRPELRLSGPHLKLVTSIGFHFLEPKFRSFIFFIFKLRLDFNSFVIAGPTTVTTTSVIIGNGLIAFGAKPVSTATQCLTDTFSITGPSGSVPPVICGTNSGEHSKQFSFLGTASIQLFLVTTFFPRLQTCWAAIF